MMKEFVIQSVNRSILKLLELPQLLKPVVDADADDDNKYLVIGKRIPWIGWKFGFEQ